MRSLDRSLARMQMAVLHASFFLSLSLLWHALMVRGAHVTIIHSKVERLLTTSVTAPQNYDNYSNSFLIRRLLRGLKSAMK